MIRSPFQDNRDCFVRLEDAHKVLGVSRFRARELLAADNLDEVCRVRHLPASLRRPGDDPDGRVFLQSDLVYLGVFAMHGNDTHVDERGIGRALRIPRWQAKQLVNRRRFPCPVESADGEPQWPKRTVLLCFWDTIVKKLRKPLGSAVVTRRVNAERRAS